jgi:hypothetical protein
MSCIVFAKACARVSSGKPQKQLFFYTTCSSCTLLCGGKNTAALTIFIAYFEKNEKALQEALASLLYRH